jgi:hypothetical protein
MLRYSFAAIPEELTVKFTPQYGKFAAFGMDLPGFELNLKA